MCTFNISCILFQQGNKENTTFLIFKDLMTLAGLTRYFRTLGVGTTLISILTQPLYPALPSQRCALPRREMPGWEK